MAVRKLTEGVLKGLPLPHHGQVYVFDSALAGFGVRLSARTRSFFAERRMHGKTHRITIGPWPHLTVDQARKQAQIILGELVQGIDRKAIQKADKVKATTLAEVWTSFQQARKNLKEKTVRQYDGVIKSTLPDWLDKPWVTITPQMVAKRHADLGKNNGPGQANLAMRILSALIRYAMEAFPGQDGNALIAKCPTGILSTTGAWYKLKPRQGLIKASQLKAWWGAVETLENRTVADYLKVILLTGLRRMEAAGLRWDDVDFEAKTLTVRDTKNHTDHVLPLTQYLYQLLLTRKDVASRPYVFPGNSRSGHLEEPKKVVAHVTKTCGVDFGIHDLRRTFTTAAESLELSAYAVKRLVNHSMGGDVTGAHYIVINIERLREPMEKIGRYLLGHAGVIPPAKVLPLASAGEAQTGTE